MDKVKILGITPYEEMRLSLLEAARHRDDIELSVYVGDMSKGVEIAKELFPGNYDVILSRGGTAKLIREKTGFPAVEISISVYDILRALRFVQNSAQKHVIIGFPNITNSAFLLNELVQSNVEIISIRSSEEVLTALERVKAEGYQVIIGDMITCNMAQQAGLGYVLITSGSESIEKAFDTAVQQCLIGQTYKRQLHLLTSMMKKWEFQALVYDQRQQIIADTLEPSTVEALGDLRNRLIQLGEKGHISFVRSNSDKDKQYSVEGEQLRSENGELCSVFRVTPRFGSEHLGLEYIDEKTAEERYMQSFLNVSLQTRELSIIGKQYVRTNQPVFITGERGTGKDSLAYSLYLQSSFRNSPMLIINCVAVQEKGWKYLFLQNGSPLFQGRQVVYFKNCSALPESYAYLLTDWLNANALSTAKSLLFSAIYPLPFGQQSNALIDCLLNSNICLKASLKPLREIQHEFRNLISFTIRNLKNELEKNIVDIEPSALDLLKAFPWNENYTQLMRVLTQAVLWTEGSEISKNTIQTVLRQEERSSHQFSGFSELIGEKHTLREIEYMIVKEVLKQENDNQSKTARRLGISRSTLWRILKENE